MDGCVWEGVLRVVQPVYCLSVAPGTRGFVASFHLRDLLLCFSKYLNNVVEQDPRAVNHMVQPVLGFKSFWSARCTIAGIEVMPAIGKGQLASTGHAPQTPAEQFSALAA